MNNNKPFSRDFVIRTTVKHQKKCIDISIQKTVDRISEFEGDPVKSKELIVTLSVLHNMRRQIEGFLV